MEKIRQILRKKRIELHEAEQSNDPLLFAEAKKELKALRQSISKVYPFLFIRGKVRDYKDSEYGEINEKARKRVSDKIHRAYKKIKNINMPLYKHLKESIKTDKTAYYYEPSERIEWII